MSLFSKKPKSIADFEKEIEKLRQNKKLSARNSERLEEYEKQLSSLKTAEEAEQKKKVRQKKIAIGSIAASVALVTCIIIGNGPKVASARKGNCNCRLQRAIGVKLVCICQ